MPVDPCLNCGAQVTYEPETRMLSIGGQRSSEHTEKDEGGRFSRFERRFGSFQRRFKLPQNVDTGAISAKVRTCRGPKTVELTSSEHAP